MQTLTPKPTLLRRLGPLLGAHFINDFFGNVLPVMLPLMETRFGLNFAMVGVITTSHTVATSGAQLLFGALGDRLVRVNFALWGPLLMGVGLSLAALMPNLALLLVAVVAAGLGSAMFHPQGTATAGALANARRGTAISLFIASGRLGAATAPVLAGALLGGLGLNAGAWVLLGGVLVAGVVLGLALPPPAQALPTQRTPLWTVFRPLLPLWAIVVCRHIVFMSFSTYLTFLLMRRGLSLTEASGIGLFVFMLGTAFGSITGGPLSDRFGRRAMIVVSFVAVVPLLWLFLNTQGALSLVWLALSGVVLVSNNPVIVAYAQERVPGHAATASAVTMGLGWLGGSAFVIPVGVLADRIGVEAALGWVIWAPLLAAALAWLVVDRRV